MSVPSSQRRVFADRLPIHIAGGGPTGMALALALHAVGRRAEVFEARTRAAVAADARILALSHGTRQILERLAAWPAAATPIASVHVSHRQGLGRVLIDAADLDAPALGYVVRAKDLIAALATALDTQGVIYREGTAITAATAGTEGIVVSAGDTDLGGAALLAWAEGSVDPVAGRQRDYAQHAVLCTAATRAPHRQRAWERFTDAGPLALLPLGAEYAVILTVSNQELDRVLGLDDDGFRNELTQRLGARHEFGALSPRLSYPLGLRWREHLTGPRQVWLGNAAQTLHPVAGQGFNLAIRDVWELAQLLGEAADPGACEVLARYAERRMVDRRGTIGFTDFLIDAFGSESAPLRHARGAGLLALDLFPPLRRFVAKRLMFGARGGL